MIYIELLEGKADIAKLLLEGGKTGPPFCFLTKGLRQLEEVAHFGLPVHDELLCLRHHVRIEILRVIVLRRLGMQCEQSIKKPA